jgi:hypothetical protein
VITPCRTISASQKNRRAGFQRRPRALANPSDTTMSSARSTMPQAWIIRTDRPVRSRIETRQIRLRPDDGERPPVDFRRITNGRGAVKPQPLLLVHRARPVRMVGMRIGVVMMIVRMAVAVAMVVPVIMVVIVIMRSCPWA